MKTTTRDVECSAAPTLLMAMELSGQQWTLAFATQAGDRPRVRTVKAAMALTHLPQELARAKQHFRLPATARVVSCHEIGYDGFWIHRALTGLGVENLVIEASSIEVKRQRRRAKSDGLDVGSLLRLLIRYQAGERKAFAVVRVPTPEQEDARQLHRALETLTTDRTRLRNQLQGLLAVQGVRRPIRGDFLASLATIQLWDGRPLPPGLRQRLADLWARLAQVEAQITAGTATRDAQLAAPAATALVAQAQHLATLKGIGKTSAWVFAMEGLAWRAFRNRREVGAFPGLTPTPYQSGTMAREVGISKAGNVRMRAMLNQISWGWLRYQPDSALSRWFETRFAHAGARARRIGIVAVARKLVIALWRYLTQGVMPDGAVVKPVAA